MVKTKEILSHGIYWPSETLYLKEVFSNYLPGHKFLDLGSGDGRVVEFALKFTKLAFGVEINEDLYKKSRDRAPIIFKNMFNLNFSGYGVLFYYLKGSNHELELIQKLNKEFEGILIVNYKSMKEKQVNTFASFLKANLVKSYNYVKVYKF